MLSLLLKVLLITSCHIRAALLAKTNFTKTISFIILYFVIKGTKGACEKNMEEAFKYSLKVISRYPPHLIFFQETSC